MGQLHIRVGVGRTDELGLRAFGLVFMGPKLQPCKGKNPKNIRTKLEKKINDHMDYTDPKKKN